MRPDRRPDHPSVPADVSLSQTQHWSHAVRPWQVRAQFTRGTPPRFEGMVEHSPWSGQSTPAASVVNHTADALLCSTTTVQMATTTISTPAPRPVKKVVPSLRPLLLDLGYFYCSNAG